MIKDVVFLDNAVVGLVDWRPYIVGLASGGALLIAGSDSDGGASVTVTGCTFINNTVHATDMYPPTDSDRTGQGLLTQGASDFIVTVPVVVYSDCVICALCVKALLSKFITLKFPSEAPALHILQGPCVCVRVCQCLLLVLRSLALSCSRVVWWGPVHHYVGRCYGKRQRARGGRRGHQQLRWFVRVCHQSRFHGYPQAYHRRWCASAPCPPSVLCSVRMLFVCFALP